MENKEIGIKITHGRKSKCKRLISAALSLVVVASISTAAFAADLKAFSDVKTSHWAYDAVMSMAIGEHKGMFSGTTDPNEQGLATFTPDRAMSACEFLTVICRAIYKDELTAMGSVSQGETWWSNTYQLSLEKGLITTEEFTRGEMEHPMNRQEMARVLVRACEVLL